MEEKDIPEELIKRYLDGTATPEEKAIVDGWHQQDFVQSEVQPTMREIDKAHRDLREVITAHAAPRVKPLWPRIAAAASVLLILSAGTYFVLRKNKPAQQQLAQNHLILPGSNKAILTLSNGQKISLTDAKTGTIANQSQTSVTKTGNGQLVYSTSGQTGSTNEVVYNTITTPRGGQWPNLHLPDGTEVMLDASSSIRYPVQFTGKERIVEITGQAYLKVKHDAQHPFKVKVRGQEIDDIGTAFNINAYDDEPVIKTTLEQGAIRIKRGDQSVDLVPSQQGITKAGDSHIQIKTVDLEDVLAWKDGETSFRKHQLPEIMRQVARWYDVDVVFEGQTTQKVFGGGISRTVKLSDLLNLLSYGSNVHFEVRGKTIIVKPK